MIESSSQPEKLDDNSLPDIPPNYSQPDRLEDMLKPDTQKSSSQPDSMDSISQPDSLAASLFGSCIFVPWSLLLLLFSVCRVPGCGDFVLDSNMDLSVNGES